MREDADSGKFIRFILLDKCGLVGSTLIPSNQVGLLNSLMICGGEMYFSNR